MAISKAKQARKNLISYWQDVAERAGRTFAQGYLAAWILAGAGYSDLFTVSNLKFGAVALALSVATALAAKEVGPKDTASFIPE